MEEEKVSGSDQFLLREFGFVPQLAKFEEALNDGRAGANLPKYQVPIFSKGGDLTAPGTTRVRCSLNRTRDETGGR